MKAMFRIASALLWVVSGAAFAAGQNTAPATTAIMPAATSAIPMADTKADFNAKEKTAMAALNAKKQSGLLMTS